MLGAVAFAGANADADAGACGGVLQRLGQVGRCARCVPGRQGRAQGLHAGVVGVLGGLPGLDGACDAFDQGAAHAYAQAALPEALFVLAAVAVARFIDADVACGHVDVAPCGHDAAARLLVGGSGLQLDVALVGGYQAGCAAGAAALRVALQRALPNGEAGSASAEEARGFVVLVALVAVLLLRGCEFEVAPGLQVHVVLAKDAAACYGYVLPGLQVDGLSAHLAGKGLFAVSAAGAGVDAAAPEAAFLAVIALIDLAAAVARFEGDVATGLQVRVACLRINFGSAQVQVLAGNQVDVACAHNAAAQFGFLGGVQVVAGIPAVAGAAFCPDAAQFDVAASLQVREAVGRAVADCRAVQVDVLTGPEDEFALEGIGFVCGGIRACLPRFFLWVGCRLGGIGKRGVDRQAGQAVAQGGAVAVGGRAVCVAARGAGYRDVASGLRQQGAACFNAGAVDGDVFCGLELHCIRLDAASRFVADVAGVQGHGLARSDGAAPVVDGVLWGI